jgi:hypothetical protein
MLTSMPSTHSWPFHRDTDWPRTVQQVALARRRLLEHDGRAPFRLAGQLAGGRLVLFDPTREWDGSTSRADSRDYFDNDNMPAWDTWVMQVPEPSPLYVGDPAHGHYLLAWVPPLLVTWANFGILANGQQCLAWAHEVTTPFLRRLRQSGLAGC